MARAMRPRTSDGDDEEVSVASSSKMSTYLQPLSNKASARCTATMCDWAHPNTDHALRVPFVRIVCNLALIGFPYVIVAQLN